MDPRRRGRDPAAAARARHRLRPLLAARPRPAHRADPLRRRLRRRRLAQDQPALHRRELPAATSPSSTRSRAIGAEIGATPAQTALAWLLTQGDDIAPIPGTRRVARVEENTAADAIELTAEQITRLDNLEPGRRRAPRRGQHGHDRPLIQPGSGRGHGGSRECSHVGETQRSRQRTAALHTGPSPGTVSRVCGRSASRSRCPTRRCWRSR